MTTIVEFYVMIVKEASENVKETYHSKFKNANLM
jgi:hypothetical protein